MNTNWVRIWDNLCGGLTLHLYKILALFVKNHRLNKNMISQFVILFFFFFKRTKLVTSPPCQVQFILNCTCKMLSDYQHYISAWFWKSLDWGYGTAYFQFMLYIKLRRHFCLFIQLIGIKCPESWMQRYPPGRMSVLSTTSPTLTTWPSQLWYYRYRF